MTRLGGIRALVFSVAPARSRDRSEGAMAAASREQTSLHTYLIIVARDRPDLFEYLTESYGHEMKVIVDRRQRPRPPFPGPRHTPSSIWYAEMQREGFMMVPTTAAKIENAA